MKMIVGERHLLVGVFVCLFFLLQSEALPHSNTEKPKVCSHYCKTPQQQIYCCDDDPFTPVHSGHCPPVLDVFCPEILTKSDVDFEPPRRCGNDGKCRRNEKCCKDKCLGGNFCKPAIP